MVLPGEHIQVEPAIVQFFPAPFVLRITQQIAQLPPAVP